MLHVSASFRCNFYTQRRNERQPKFSRRHNRLWASTLIIIVPGGDVRGSSFQQTIYPRRKLSGYNHMGTIFLGGNFPGAIVQGVVD